MTKTTVGLPCPSCGYDLRGLASGRCPECGGAFCIEDLEPEQPGLVLEQWADAARTFGKKVTLPFAIAFSPRKAFQRRCRLEATLTTSSSRILLSFLVSYLLLMVASVATRYTLDKVQGLQLNVGWYWNPTSVVRFGSAVLLPVHLPIAWAQCLVVTLIGVVLGGRGLSASRIIRLATWLLPFALLAGLFTILYAPALAMASHPVAVSQWSRVGMRLQFMIFELGPRGHDLVLGLAGGFAVGTVMQRRRWLITMVSAAVLVASFPVCMYVQRAFSYFIYEPVRAMAVGPRPLHMFGPTLLSGPTFAVGGVEPALAGTWTIRYDGEEQASAELTFDETGALVSWRVKEDSTVNFTEFVADGANHEAVVPEEMADTLLMSYRVLSGSKRELDHISMNLRLELSYERQQGEDFFVYLGSVVEESFVGVFDADDNSIAGTNTWVRNSQGVNIEPGQTERSL